jgi:hypothetical protein
MDRHLLSDTGEEGLNVNAYAQGLDPHWDPMETLELLRDPYDRRLDEAATPSIGELYSCKQPCRPTSNSNSYRS